MTRLFTLWHGTEALRAWGLENTVLPSRRWPSPQQETHSLIDIPPLEPQISGSIPFTSHSSPQCTWTCHQCTEIWIWHGSDNENCYFLQQHSVCQPWHPRHPHPGQRNEDSVNWNVSKTFLLILHQSKCVSEGPTAVPEEYWSPYSAGQSGSTRRADNNVLLCLTRAFSHDLLSFLLTLPQWLILYFL